MDDSRDYFGRLNSTMLVATFFSLWLAVYLENRVEDTLGYIMILSFGILHGANDIKLLQTTAKKERKSPVYLRILLYYIIFVIAVAGLFYLVPTASLSLFILFSAYHFGEQHWTSRFKGRGWPEAMFFSFYGLFVLFLLFTAHGDEVSSIVYDICGVRTEPKIYLIALAVSGIILVLLYIKIVKQIKREILLELFYLGVFFIVFNTASLLWAFAIYFIIWHSIPSLSDQINYLYGVFDRQNFLKYVRSSAIYWGLSVLSLVLLFNFVDQSNTGFLPFLFSFLAAITFPHVFVIRKLNKN